MLTATVVSLLGIYVAWLVYGKKSISRDIKMPALYGTLYNKYYIDEIYQYIIVAPTKAISLFLQYIETFLVEGIMKAVIGIVEGLARLGSKFQSGHLK